MILVVDHYDSFTYNLVQLIESLGTSHGGREVRRRAAAGARRAEAGCRDPVTRTRSPRGRRLFTSLLALLPAETPVLGVCLGHQALGVWCGGVVLAYEAGVTETPDPLAGSYYVESLTNELEASAWAYLDEIESMGGTLAAIEGGFQQRQIHEAAYRVQRAIEAGDQIVVGVNQFRDDDVHTPALHGRPRR